MDQTVMTPRAKVQTIVRQNFTILFSQNMAECLRSSPLTSFSSSCPSSPPSGSSGQSNKIYTLYSACSHHTPKPLYYPSTSNTPPEGAQGASTRLSSEHFCKDQAHLHVPHVATGSTVMSSPGQGVEGLPAGHTQGHLVVSDPARGASAQFFHLCDTETIRIRMVTL